MRRQHRWWKGVGAVPLALLLSGCACDPYKDALHRWQDTGRAVQPYLKPAPDPSVQALYDAFDAAIKEPIK